SNVVAARAGNTNERINFVLNKFGVEAPLFISDLSPRVSDVMNREVISVSADSAVYKAIQLIDQKRLRGLPVIDGENRFLGLLSAFKISHHLFPPREEASNARVILASLAGIVETFAGQLLCGTLHAETTEHLLLVGAMNYDTFGDSLQRYEGRQIVLVVGDRSEIQTRAIDANVCAIVVTGSLPVHENILRRAGEKGTTIISSPHDTATTVLLARGAVRAGRMIEPEFTSFSPDTLLEEAREKAAASASFVFPIVNEDGTLAGILSKSDFLKPPARQLILVDHNELSQAVPGADKVPIIEILDHHRLGGFSSESPILFWNNPVGSTSTIVTLCYQQAGVAIPSEVAGLLMAGLISDTLNLTSPTATHADQQALLHLSKLANTNPSELAEQIFSVGSPLLTMEPDQVVTADCKEYEEGNARFSVAQIEEISFSHLPEKQAGLIESLEGYRRSHKLLFSALLVTDVNTQTSLLLVCGAPEFLRRIDFPTHGANTWAVDGIVSRKKQLLPYLLQCLALAKIT
ncbi:MAG: putative manganese-dependent inorganic diphosphatase, partial [Verrucomicrobiota bacterium]